MQKNLGHHTVRIVCMFFLLLFLSACKKESAQQTQVFTNKDIHIVQKVDSLLALMTLDEKIGQMAIVRHFADIEDNEIASKFIGAVIHTEGPQPGKSAKQWQHRFYTLQEQALSSRLGIPLFFGVDAIHGQNTYPGATIFPHNIGLGATQNAKLVSKIARITAIEARATGFNWVFSPCVAIPYNEKWGRVYEAFSENTELTQKMTEASIRGLQGTTDSSFNVMATAKHFIGDGATDFGKEGGVTSLGIAEVTQRLLPPYRTAVAEGVGSIMTSFNEMNSQAMHAHKSLITYTLKAGMDFNGIVVSDWKGYSRFGENAIINAGVDMVMAVDGDLDNFLEGVKKGVENGAISQGRIDDAVRRILYQKFRFGLFENPYPDTAYISKIGCDAHRNIAKQAVRESLVLLKNDSILPLNTKAKKIVVVGEHANNTGLQSGGWTIHWQGTTANYKGGTTILQGIENIAEGEVFFDEEAKDKYADADVAIIVVGEVPYAEFFGDVGGEFDICQLELSEKHKKYIETYTKLGVKTVVILISGRPMAVTSQIHQSDAFVAAWLPGSEGEGVAEVLFGLYDFTGKLPHSWLRSISDCSGKYGPNFWSDTIKPLYPYNYGLYYNREKLK